MSLSQIEIESNLKNVGAWLEGHFLLTSGLHSDQYIQCQKIMQYPRYGLSLAEALVEKLSKLNLEAHTVVGPALGAIHWEVFVAQAIEKKYPSLKEPVRAIFAERPEGKFEIRRGLQLNENEKVIVVEDVTTTGGSVKQVIDLIRNLGAIPVAVGSVIDRSGGNMDFGIPFVSLVQLKLASYEASSCPMCQEGRALIKPGSSKQTSTK